jgi:hypothetical protein
VFSNKDFKIFLYSRAVKIVVLLPILLFLATQCWGQGVVNFGNNPVIFSDTIDRLVYLDSVGGTRLAGTNFVAELWYGSDANSLTAVAPPVARFRDVPSGDPFAGIWAGGIRTLNGFTSGETATLQVRVWDITRYSSFEQAVLSPGAVFGSSQPFNYTVPPGGTMEGFTMINLRAFALVPEPSVLFLTPLLLTALLYIKGTGPREKLLS